MRSMAASRGAMGVLVATLVLATASLVIATAAAAQAPAGGPEPEDAPPLRLGAQATGLLTHSTPVPGGTALTEAYLIEPVIFAGLRLVGGADPGGGPAADGATHDPDAAVPNRTTGTDMATPATRATVAARTTINLEGWTLERGELAVGNAGEGYVDRRHPHTLLHEAVATASAARAGWSASVTAGRGFAPFGTDDPMVRPFMKYPANHHLAQILERWILVGAVGRAPVLIEAGLFNGDEPVDPWDLGRVRRFGDSWSVRATVRPRPWLELQASRASVESPEHDAGAGLDQRKWSASARLDVSMSGAAHVYLLAEWAETSDWSASERVYVFRSFLGEAAWRRTGWMLAGRLERTTRPEEERLSNVFRSVRPHGDENIVGVTRWTTATLHAERGWSFGVLGVAPFVEASYSAVSERTGSIFDPVALYGDDRLWTLSLGLRLRGGARHGRMGRYGVAVPAGESMHE